MVPDVGPNIYEHASGFEIFLNDVQFLGFVKFTTEVMRLHQIAAISDKKSKIFSIFFCGYENSFNPCDISNLLCYRKSGGSA